MSRLDHITRLLWSTAGCRDRGSRAGDHRVYYYAWDGDREVSRRGDKFDSGLRNPYTGTLRNVYNDFRSYVNAPTP